MANNALESTSPFLSRSLRCFGGDSLLQAARKPRGFHPAKCLAAQRGVNPTK